MREEVGTVSLDLLGRYLFACADWRNNPRAASLSSAERSSSIGGGGCVVFFAIVSVSEHVAWTSTSLVSTNGVSLGWCQPIRRSSSCPGPVVVGVGHSRCSRLRSFVLQLDRGSTVGSGWANLGRGRRRSPSPRLNATGSIAPVFMFLLPYQLQRGHE